MKRIVVYYSLTNNIDEAAMKIAKAMNIDILRIDTKKPMPDSMGKQFLIGGMKATFGMKPAIKPIDVDLHEYDEIILGTPVWASKSAPAINTLLKDEKVCRKVTALFTCSGGGDNDKCVMTLRRKLLNLRHVVALTDRNQKGAENNEEKLSKFIVEIS